MACKESGPNIPESILGKAVGQPSRLAVRVADQFVAARVCTPQALERGLGGALTVAGEMIGTAPDEIGIAKVELGLPILLPPAKLVLLGVAAQIALVRQQEIRKDLVIEGPVAHVIQDEHGVDLEIVGKVGVGAIRPLRVDWLGERWELAVVALLRVLDKRKDCGIGLPDVTRGDNTLKSVAWRLLVMPSLSLWSRNKLLQDGPRTLVI